MLNISTLNKIQLGAYGENKAKEYYSIRGYYTYTCDSDDHGIDFLTEDAQGSIEKVQVKSIRKTANNGLIIISKDKISDTENFKVFVNLFDIDNDIFKQYLIPAHDIIILKNPKCFKSYDYIGKKSKPEYDITFNKNYLEDFKPYEI